MKNNTLIALKVVCLVGCSEQSPLEKSFSNYAKRMANVLDVDPVTLTKPALSTPSNALPRKAELTITNNETIDLLTLTKLNQCGLGPLIAQRNTSLGKSQLPSTRFAWEVHFYHQLTYCAQQPLDKKTAEVVANLLAFKTETWDTQWTQLIQTSDPIRQSLQQNVSLINGKNDGLTETMAALSYLRSLQKNRHQDITAPLNKLEYHLQNLNSTKLPASVWRTQYYITDNLNQLTDWLEKNIDMDTCAKDKRFHEKATYLRNVFQLFFIEEIQPITSTLNSYLYQINPIIEELMASKTIEKQFKYWVLDKANEKEYTLAIKHHVQFWQGFFEACKFSPGR